MNANCPASARVSRVGEASRHRGLFGYVRNLREALAQRKTVSARRRTQHARRVRYPHANTRASRATQSGSDRLPLRDCGPPVKEYCRNEHARAHVLPRMIRVYSRALAAVFVRPTRPPLHHRALRGRCARIFLGASKVWIKIGTEKSRRWEFRRSHRNSTLDISY